MYIWINTSARNLTQYIMIGCENSILYGIKYKNYSTFCLRVHVVKFQMMFVSFKSNTTGATNEEGTANPSGAIEFISSV
jgi:uncharacterized integral membrane protein